ncbi:hypothetical protein SEA_SPEEDDEMON_270 [Gordonia phage SpeedDemon]|nr:hypothetical protein SEA_SPEEDDEMON_270 [Gordonia phage SpeedDemon]
MSTFTPIQLVHHKTQEEVTAYSAVGLNNLVAAGYARKNEVRQSDQVPSNLIGDTISDDVAPIADAPADSTEGDSKPTTSRAKRR